MLLCGRAAEWARRQRGRTQRYDYIVVGAGTAGCIVANQLSSARPRKSRVLLLEAGGRDNWIWFHIPVGYLFAIGNPRSDWMFKHRGGAGPERPRARLSARQGDRRLVGDQRDDLDARPGGRLRPLAAARPDRLGLGRRAAALQGGWRIISSAKASITASAAAGGSSRRACPGSAGRRWRSRGRDGHSAQPDFNTGDNEGSAISTSTRSAAAAGRRARVPQAGCHGRTCGSKPMCWSTG
jgi:choline dehydrogenase-like flavoprotein